MAVALMRNTASRRSPAQPGPIGILIKQQRELLELTQEELAEKIGVSHVALGDWERGKRNPKEMHVRALQQEFDPENKNPVLRRQLMDYAGFLGDRNDEPVLNPSTQRIVDIYESLSTRERRVFDRFVESFVSEDSEGNEEDPELEPRKN